jgi:hypothetical protein
MFRRLLDVASIISLVACMALMGMWVRSDYAKDEWHGTLPNAHGFVIHSVQGVIVLYEFPLESNGRVGLPSDWPIAVMGDAKPLFIFAQPRGSSGFSRAFGFAEYLSWKGSFSSSKFLKLR